MAPIMATVSVTGGVLGTPNAKMKELLGKGGRIATTSGTTEGGRS